MFANRRSNRQGFTLVEMLVVLGIIAVLVALLMPAVMSAVNNGRRARIGVEISQLANAVEAYKQKHGDYPPTFRNYQVFLRHVRRAFPKIDAAHLTRVQGRIWQNGTTSPPSIDEGEALVFWLSLVDSDGRLPFRALDPNYTLGQPPPSPQKFYEFDERRLVYGGAEGSDGDPFPSYRAIYCHDTCYILIDSRAYADHYAGSSPVMAEAESGNCGEAQPYWSEILAANPTNSTSSVLKYKPMNATTFQILCAGQDGEFVDSPSTAVKFFPGGGGYQAADKDNLTNFSEGRRLQDHIP